MHREREREREGENTQHTHTHTHTRTHNPALPLPPRQDPVGERVRASKPERRGGSERGEAWQPSLVLVLLRSGQLQQVRDARVGSLSHTHPLSQPPTLTYTLQMLIYTHKELMRYELLIALSRARIHTLTHSLTHSKSHSRNHSLTHSHTHADTHTHTYTPLSLSHTLIQGVDALRTFDRAVPRKHRLLHD